MRELSYGNEEYIVFGVGIAISERGSDVSRMRAGLVTMRAVANEGRRPRRKDDEGGL